MASGDPAEGTAGTTSIDSLIASLSAGLSALAPVAERAGIPWRDGEAYDDWDELASLLFDVFVARPIAIAPKELPLADYDMLRTDWTGYSTIEVHGAGPPLMVFNRLLAAGGSFDRVHAVPVDPSGLAAVGDPVDLALRDTSMRVARRGREEGSAAGRSP